MSLMAKIALTMNELMCGYDISCHVNLIKKDMNETCLSKRCSLNKHNPAHRLFDPLSRLIQYCHKDGSCLTAIFSIISIMLF